MILRRLYPDPGTEFNVDSVEGRATLDSLYAAPSTRWLRLNLISSVNGSAAGNDGTSESLTNRLDRRILGTIRRLADTVLVGANSVRTEGYFLPKTASLAILTGSGDLTGHRIPEDVDDGKVIVFCPTHSVAKVKSTLPMKNVTIVELSPHSGEKDDDAQCGHPQVHLADVVRAMHVRGLENIVCEGGPTLAGKLLDSGLVDELCLSTSPQLSSVATPVFPGLSAPRPLHLNQLLSDPEGHLFARWSVAK